ncbi:MAG: alkaline phosphatase family protein [bacterium]|nr:alkaline phosphatase family protein [bacterium]
MAYAESAREHGLHAVVITDNVEHRARRFARSWSVAVAGLFLVLAATVGLPHGPDLEAWERQAQVATLAVIWIGILVAWKWEGLGGSILLVSSTSLGVLAALQHQPLTSFLPAAAFLIPGVAFLVAWHRTRTMVAVVTMAVTLTVILGAGGYAAQAMYNHGYGPAHPQSDLPRLPDSPVAWMWAGAVTDGSAEVVARVEDAGDVDLVAVREDGLEASYPGNREDDVWSFALIDLEPATEYQYRLEVDGVVASERVGRFHTFATGSTSFTVAVGSCARLGSSGTVYEAIRAAEPDMFLIPGDFFYADHIETFEQFTEAFDETLTSPAQAALLADVPIAYIWDDHDYGGNDADSTSSTRGIAREAYRAYVPHYPLADSGTINQSFSVGRVRFLMLDNRSARDPKAAVDNAAKTMLGAEQLAWLEAELLEAEGEYPLTVIVTSVPWIADPAEGADHWGGYSMERRALADFIASNELDGLLMVAGDAHMIAIDNGTNTNFSTVQGASFPLLHAAALDRPGSVKGGPYSEGVFPGGGQFGLIEVTDSGTDLIEVRLAGFDWTGEQLIEFSFVVDAREGAS